MHASHTWRARAAMTCTVMHFVGIGPQLGMASRHSVSSGPVAAAVFVRNSWLGSLQWQSLWVGSSTVCKCGSPCQQDTPLLPGSCASALSGQAVSHGSLGLPDCIILGLRRSSHLHRRQCFEGINRSSAGLLPHLRRRYRTLDIRFLGPWGCVDRASRALAGRHCHGRPAGDGQPGVLQRDPDCGGWLGPSSAFVQVPPPPPVSPCPHLRPRPCPVPTLTAAKHACIRPTCACYALVGQAGI